MEHVPWFSRSGCSTKRRLCPAWIEHRLPRRKGQRDPIAVAFGEAVRRARKDRGQTIEDVAGTIVRNRSDGTATTMDPKYLSSIENGWHSPTIVTAKLIADALDVSLSTLTKDL